MLCLQTTKPIFICFTLANAWSFTVNRFQKDLGLKVADNLLVKTLDSVQHFCQVINGRQFEKMVFRNFVILTTV